MSIRRLSRTLTLAVVLAFSTQAIALNPQPEPPAPYHGYEYIISRLGHNEWRWEIHKRLDGKPPQILSHGSIRGSHFRAVNAARQAIDHLATPQSPH
jgi:hypothetical protein